MIVPSQKMKDVDDFMKKLDKEVKERKVIDFRMAHLQNDLRRMSRDRMSVERSGDVNRIGTFNRLFIAKLAELSRIMQTHGFSSRDEAAQMVREIKAQ